MPAARIVRPASAIVVCCLVASPAFAHSGVAGGLAGGFLHPILGIDLPVVFPMVMALGGAAGVLGVPLAGVEFGIAGSVTVLGLAVALAARPALWLGGLIVGTLAIFHGHAHGTELPAAADPMAYAVGFVVATGLIHAVGIGIGMITHLPRGAVALRVAGGAVCAAGLALLAAPIGL
jgi:urease accessory protein